MSAAARKLEDARLDDDVIGRKLASGILSSLPALVSGLCELQVANDNGESARIYEELASESLIARDYDPAIGRWVSKDPSGFRGRSANLYAYANNDPVNLRDPSGLTVYDCHRMGAGPYSLFVIHEYQCVVSSSGNQSLEPVCWGWGGENDQFDPDACVEITPPKDLCMDECMKQEFEDKPDYYFPFISDCSTTADRNLDVCSRKCHSGSDGLILN